MLKKPRVKFNINANQDIENYILFRKYSLPKFLNMFLPTELQYILNKNLSEKIAEDIVQKYVKEKFKVEGNLTLSISRKYIFVNLDKLCYYSK